MTCRPNRKELIVKVASELFLEQGYESTSVRQIADEVGVTEAALYYHFKDGKRELLQAVVDSQMPSFKYILDQCRDAESLPDLMQRHEQAFSTIAPKMAPRMRWLICEYPNLDEKEKNRIHHKLIAYQIALAALIEPFVADAVAAKNIAWTLICVTIGHSQVFMSMDLQSAVDFPYKTLIENLAKSFT